MKRFCQILPRTFLLAGLALLFCTSLIPVYTDASAPRRLTVELQKPPLSEASREWYSQLRSFETSHKRLSDWGRGLAAFGIGLFLAKGIMIFYRRAVSHRWMPGLIVGAIWLSLWAFRLPASGWYYRLRQSRFDFPLWADTVAIYVMSECFVWIAGAIFSGLVMLLLTARRAFPNVIQGYPQWPKGMLGQLRFCLLGLWLVLLACCVVAGVIDGDEGMTISCTVAFPLLYGVILATPRQPDDPNAPRKMAISPLLAELTPDDPLHETHFDRPQP